MFIKISVKNKVAMRKDGVSIVCGNSDYVIKFDFDGEWAPYETKTARFVTNVGYTDVVFNGNEVSVPVITDASFVRVGVYAGNLHTTTPAVICCNRSITDGSGSPVDPTPDVYAQLMEMLNKESGIWYPTVDDAGNMSWARSITETEPAPINIKGPKGDPGAQGATGATGPQGEKGATGERGPQGEKGDVGPRGPQGETGPQGERGATGATGPQGPKGDTGAQGPKGDTGYTGPAGPIGPAGAAGKDGKSAYQYAVEGGYTGTEAEFEAKLTAEMPDKLPNPNALTFTGSVTGTYDGSAPLSVEIPSGSGGSGEERGWSQLANVDLSAISKGNIELTGLDNYTDFYILWEESKNESDTASAFALQVNGKDIAKQVVPILDQNNSSMMYGWIKVNYDGLVWNVQRSSGAVSPTNYGLNNTNSYFPYNHVLGLGKATTFKLISPVPMYAAVSGTIKIYGR